MNNTNLNMAIENRIAKQQKRIYFFTAIAVVFFILLFVFNKWEKKQESEARTRMYGAERLFEVGQYDDALNGTDEVEGFLSLSMKFPRFTTGNLIKFYLGLSFLKLNNVEEAKKFLSKVSFKDNIMKIKLTGLLGDIEAELKNYEKALKFYEKAVSIKKIEGLTPIFMEKIALLQEYMGNKKKALKTYLSLCKEFPNHKIPTIDFNKERLKKELNYES